MRIIVDADACPVKNIIETVAKEMKIPVTMIIDTSHLLTSEYSEIITVSKAADAVDFAVINLAKKGDIIVTQDYGVAAMALGKEAFAIHQSGKWYSNDTIDDLLMTRHLTKKAVRSNKKAHIKGPKKRTPEDDLHFESSFRLLCQQCIKQEVNNKDGASN